MPKILTSRVQSFMVDDVDYSLEAVSAQIVANPTDFRPLGAGAPENEYAVQIEAGQDLTTTSLWTLAYTNTNQAVQVVLKPYGNNDEPSLLKPWVVTIAIVTEASDTIIGGDAETSTTAKRTFSMTWPCIDKPRVVTEITDV